MAARQTVLTRLGGRQEDYVPVSGNSRWLAGVGLTSGVVRSGGDCLGCLFSSAPSLGTPVADLKLLTFRRLEWYLRGRCRNRSELRRQFLGGIGPDFREGRVVMRHGGQRLHGHAMVHRGDDFMD
jgi:hypothetical protein